MKTTFVRAGAFFFLVALCASCATNRVATHEFTGATPLQWSARLADSEMTRLGDK